MNASREINDNVNSIERLDSMQPDNNEAEKEQASNTTNLLYSDNIVAVCEAVNSEVPQHRILSEEERHERRLESNRLSARRRRQRHASQVQDLQEQVRNLSSENLELKAEHDRLQALMRHHTGVNDSKSSSDVVALEMKEADEKEDEHYRYQQLVVEGESILERNVSVDRMTANEHHAFDGARHSHHEDNLVHQHRMDSNDAPLTINQPSMLPSPPAVFPNVAEQRFFSINNPLDNIGDNINGAGSSQHRNSQADTNFAIPPREENESSESISIPGDVSDYFDMLFHSQDGAIDSNELTRQVQASEQPLAVGQAFQSGGAFHAPNVGAVARVRDFHTNSPSSSLSSCPVLLSNGLSNEHMEDIGSVTEDIFDSK